MNSDKDTFELKIVGPVSRTRHLSSVHKYVILGSSVAHESVSFFPPPSSSLFWLWLCMLQKKKTSGPLRQACESRMKICECTAA